MGARGRRGWVQLCEFFLCSLFRDNDAELLTKAYVLFPQSFKEISELLVPELRRRGMFWDDYAVPGGTYRENFYRKEGQKRTPEEHVATSYRWKAGVSAEEAVIPN